MGHADLIALWLSLRLATLTTLLLLLLCAPLAWWLAMGASRSRTVIDSLVSLPLVLPPTVLGFYLLLMLGPQRCHRQRLPLAGVARARIHLCGPA